MASPQSKSVLNDAEREITKTVIRRFVSLDKSTSQRFLLKELKPFRGSLVEALRVLVGHSILNIVHDTHGEERYSPRAIAFHYCGDADALTFAKKSTEIILSVVQNLYEHELEAGANEQKPFTRQNAEAEARSIDPAVTPEMIWVGLALAEEFSIFRTLQRNTQQIGVTTFLPSPHIFELADNPWDDHRDTASGYFH